MIFVALKFITIAKKSTNSTKKASAGASKKKSASKGAFWQKLMHYILISVIVFFVSTISWVVLYKFIDPPFTYLMAKRKIIHLFSGEGSSKVRYSFVPYSKISDQIKLAVISSEDQKFPDHNGFDLVSIAKAMEKNKFAKKIKGASTISQQTAKNAFLWDGRNFIRKGLEAYFTFLIEIIWGKKRILEVYLNIAEMGSLTFGIEAASKRYFDKHARQLTQTEAALIAATLPNPIIFKADMPSTFILKRRNWIQNQMNNLGGIEYIKNLK